MPSSCEIHKVIFHGLREDEIKEGVALGNMYTEHQCPLCEVASLQAQNAELEESLSEQIDTGLEHADEVIALRERVDAQGEILHRIKQWSEAYPIDVFPEPNLKNARNALLSAGETLDAVSAYAMRHVVTKIAAMIPTPTPEEG